jgi:hypothetical protein
MPRAGEAMLDGVGLAQLIKLMPTAFAAGGVTKEPIGELLAVVGQKLANLDGAGLRERLEEGRYRARGPVGFDLDEYLTCG